MITFSEVEFDLGDVIFGNTKDQPVLITNNSDKAVVINNSGSSCSCTTGSMDRNPIEAYKSQTFKIVFNSAKSGRGLQQKNITISWNDENNNRTNSQILKFKVNVVN